MTIKEMLNLDPTDVDRMTERELRSVVSRMASAANKRLRRLSEAEMGDMSFAYQFATQRSYKGRVGGSFGVEGKKRAQLLSEYKAIKHFMGMKTSTARGWNKVRRSFKERVGEFSSERAERQFWKTYRQFTELHPEALAGKGGSDEVQKMLHDTMFTRPGGAGRAVEQINRHNAAILEVPIPEGRSILLTSDGDLIEINTRSTGDRALILSELETMNYELRTQKSNKRNTFPFTS